MNRTFLLIAAFAVFIASGADAFQRRIPTDAEVELIQNSLGWGYDAVKGDFASVLNDTMRMPLFEVRESEDLINEMRGDFRFVASTASDQVTYSGKTTADFAKNFCHKVGVGFDVGMFSGALGYNSTGSTSTSTEQSYVVIEDLRTMFEATLTLDPSKTRKRQNGKWKGPQEVPYQAKVRQEVLDTINALPTHVPKDEYIEKIIKRFGTHYVAGAQYGGKITLFYAEDYKHEQSIQEMVVNVDAKYGAAKANVGVENASSAAKAKMSGRGELRVKGGRQTGLNRAKFETATDTGKFVPGELDKWAESIEENCEFIGFSKGGLMPIETLPGLSQHRRNQLYTARKHYAKHYATGNAYKRIVPPKPAPVVLPRALGKYEKITLKNGRKFINCYEGSHGFYPVMGTTPQEIHILTQDGGALENGAHVRLAYVGFDHEGDHRKDWGSWTNNIWMFSGPDVVYLSTEHGNRKAHWKIWKKEGGNWLADGEGQDPVIRFGDTVKFENVAKNADMKMDSGGTYLDAGGDGADLEFVIQEFK